MNMRNKEPIAIYYARLMKNGRIIIPEGTRSFLKLKEGDQVELKVKPAEDDVSALFISNVGKRGLVVIPKHIRERLSLKPGSWLEVTLLAIYRPIIRAEGSV
ncbi:AbrB/MazE/SpoVT family DNA-binding domain-containing protein [Thermococcus henrietii]|uniref:AbrB/MazE/SpoVT family DNA-binding domain-containing protein n=1 Tax=Thermococcus henrietii TaxID=2016361 RepID=UPI000C06AD05|nr:AbrB/MazE/SpoVT family DNA-binding domain-containing protein [Thermococcus henrietii]